MGGGFGGGMGGQGGIGGRTGNTGDEYQTRPEDDRDERLWTERTAILTPGDRVEYKITLKKGDTLFAGAQSDAFDPALSVTDGKGKEFLKNDDREEGDQSPFVNFKAPEDDTYLLRVLSYRSAAGGKFMISFRTFTPIDAKFEKQVHTAPKGDPEERIRTVFRLPVKQGKIYNLGRLVGSLPTNDQSQTQSRYEAQPALLRLVGPTGVARNDFRSFRSPAGLTMVEALKDGDLYAEYQADRSVTLRTDFREVVVVPGKPAETLNFDLSPGETRIVEIPVTPNMVVHTTITGNVGETSITVPSDPGGAAPSNSDQTYGSRTGWSWYRLKSRSDNDVVRVFKHKETARLMVESWDQEAPHKVTVANTDTLPEWRSGTPIKDQIGIGEVRLYQLTGTKSGIMNASFKASQFLIQLDFFRLNGERNRVYSAEGESSFEFYFQEPETYIVRVCCVGYGGSGPFTISRETVVPKAYKLGANQTMQIDGKGFSLFSVDLEAGKPYQLVKDRADKEMTIEILDDDGQRVQPQTMIFNNVIVRYFTPTKSGRYRLWFLGPSGTWKFRLEPFTPPSINS